MLHARNPEYQWHPMAPGVYAEFREHSGTPEGFVFGAGWAAARPFALKSQDQFRSLPPPDIGSRQYAEAFDEVKELGRFDSASRTIGGMRENLAFARLSPSDTVKQRRPRVWWRNPACRSPRKSPRQS
jgi:hypothetical protein